MLAFELYIDMFALVPQVVMMGTQSIPVQSPVAHYVVAIAISRMMDLWYWCHEFGVFTKGLRHVSYSGYFIMFLHVVNLAIVSDFFYYYCKNVVGKLSFNEDVALDV